MSNEVMYQKETNRKVNGKLFKLPRYSKSIEAIAGVLKCSSYLVGEYRNICFPLAISICSFLASVKEAFIECDYFVKTLDALYSLSSKSDPGSRMRILLPS